MTFPDLKTNLVTALSALALGCTAIAAQSDAGATDGLACGVDLSTSGGMVTIEGIVTADAPTTGTYHLRVERGGALMNQGGAFNLRAGETETLGQVRMNGPASSIDAELTLTLDGQTARCPSNL